MVPAGRRVGGRISIGNSAVFGPMAANLSLKLTGNVKKACPRLPVRFVAQVDPPWPDKPTRNALKVPFMPCPG
jgi:hypothetical protein